MGKDNKMLRHEVEDLQQQSMIMAQVLKSYSKRPMSSKSQASHAPTVLKRKMQRLAAIDTPKAIKWYGENHPGGGTLKTTLNGIQENPLNLIDSTDPTRDPYDPDR
jgi:adenine C2-methylase RlmN of 23S rRNA A2503 and tRNA A37